jgi:hypothetical protein
MRIETVKNDEDRNYGIKLHSFHKSCKDKTTDDTVRLYDEKVVSSLISKIFLDLYRNFGDSWKKIDVLCKDYMTKEDMLSFLEEKHRLHRRRIKLKPLSQIEAIQRYVQEATIVIEWGIQYVIVFKNDYSMIININEYNLSRELIDERISNGTSQKVTLDDFIWSVFDHKDSLFELKDYYILGKS